MKHQAPPNHDLDRRDQAFAEAATPAPVHDQHDNDLTEAQPEPTDPLARRVYALSEAGLIFGRRARPIAAELNRDGLPGPGGRPWGDTTIRGQMDRGTGILNNTLYIGQLTWNRCSYVKDPATGKRVARPNNADKHEVVPVPELRIIDDELWQKVKARQMAVRTEMRQG
ncbi:MAG TPA: recombinase family protein [Acidocella sp.]|jgi:hypothetical protein|nr:recombinase family protein [Acidocella sp.]